MHFEDAHLCNTPFCVIWTHCVKVTNAARNTNVCCRHLFHLQCIMQWAQRCVLPFCCSLPAVPTSERCAGILKHPSRCRSRECPLCFRHLQLEVSSSLSDILHAMPDLEACLVEAPEEMCLSTLPGDIVFQASPVSCETSHVQQTVTLGRPVPFRKEPAASSGH